MPEGGALLVAKTGMKQVFHEVELLAGAHDDVRLSGHQRVVDGDFVHVLPGVFPVVDVEDDLGSKLLGKHHGFQGGLTGGAVGQSCAGDQEDLGASDVPGVHVVHMELEVRDAVAVHKDATLAGRQHLREGQAQLFAALAAGDVAGVDALRIEVIHHEVPELVVGDLAQEAGLEAVPGDAHSDIGRGAANELLKHVDVFQRLELLLDLVVIGRVEVDRNAPQED